MQVPRSIHMLSTLAERHPTLLLRLGRWEASWAADDLAGQSIDRPIYVTGLARSGSTILLELLAAHPEVATHQYRDFPLIPIPLWWNWFLERASRAEIPPVERAHKDRIAVTPESPEAMEEVLWMTFFPDCHDAARSNLLGAQHSAPGFEAFYRDHIRKLLLLRQGRRYVAKGNYNVSRLGYLRTLFPDACFVVPVRDPVGHIASLMKQHRLFCAEETRDSRILDHMRRSGHFEFGLDRRPINFGDLATVRRIETLWQEGREVEGWAHYWASVYGHVADLLERDRAVAERTLLVHYDDLCARPDAILERLYRHCGFEVAEATRREQAARIAAPTYYKAAFADDETGIIRAATDATAARIRRLIDAETAMQDVRAEP
ncbi:MAG TPA: sulfotransferase [Geminicoccaceae bacterium]|nr:sulfotransferase [Geminicoccaceae bacterium]